MASDPSAPRGEWSAETGRTSVPFPVPSAPSDSWRRRDVDWLTMAPFAREAGEATICHVDVDLGELYELIREMRLGRCWLGRCSSS